MNQKLRLPWEHMNQELRLSYEQTSWETMSAISISFTVKKLHYHTGSGVKITRPRVQSNLTDFRGRPGRPDYDYKRILFKRPTA